MFKKACYLFLIFFIIYPLFPKTEANQTLAATCAPPSLTPPDNTCEISEGVTVNATVPETTVTFSGFAPANSTVSFKENLSTLGTTVTNPSGIFNRTIVSTAGNHNYKIFLTDTSGRTTPETLTGNVSLSSHVDTPIEDIHLPPTIALSKTSLSSGQSITIFGQAAPGSTLHLILNGNQIYTSVVGGGSSWSRTISSGYQNGNNQVYAYLSKTGLANSINSHTLSFTVGSCKRSDLNCDGRVNLTDFSILLFYWDKTNATADINGDGRVGLIDFSIMLFDWTD